MQSFIQHGMAAIFPSLSHFPLFFFLSSSLIRELDEFLQRTIRPHSRLNVRRHIIPLFWAGASLFFIAERIIPTLLLPVCLFLFFSGAKPQLPMRERQSETRPSFHNGITLLLMNWINQMALVKRGGLFLSARALYWLMLLLLLRPTCYSPPHGRKKEKRKERKKKPRASYSHENDGAPNISCMHAVCVKCLSVPASNAPDVDNARHRVKDPRGPRTFSILNESSERERERNGTRERI